MTPGLQHAQPHAVHDLIANAILAAQAIDSAKSEDLRALLTLAAHEADRVMPIVAMKPAKAKAAKETSAKETSAKKRPVKKAAAKEIAQPIVEKAATAKTRTKKAQSLNGAAH